MIRSAWLMPHWMHGYPGNAASQFPGKSDGAQQKYWIFSVISFYIDWIAKRNGYHNLVGYDPIRMCYSSLDSTVIVKFILQNLVQIGSTEPETSCFELYFFFIILKHYCVSKSVHLTCIFWYIKFLLQIRVFRFWRVVRTT